jgi:acyl-[acyl-carrier-protein]-phospholipid O-acyltransferase/long-chain-fatty-acid--[acyl-carrier-protein] ligase
MLARLDIHAADVILNLAPPHSALGLSITASLPLLACARTISPPPGQTAPEIARDIYLSSATVLFAPASVLQSLADKADPYELRSIRHLICIDGDVPPSLRTTFSDRFGLRILQSYGLGERVPLAALSTPLYFDLRAFGRLLPGTRATPRAEGACKRLWFSGPATAVGLHLSARPGRLTQAPELGWIADSVAIDDAGFLHTAGSTRRSAASPEAVELAMLG